jgi:hypothetical protein
MEMTAAQAEPKNGQTLFIGMRQPLTAESG